MKGLVVFDDKSSIAFFSLDKELENYISDRIKQLESEAGAKTEDTQSAYRDIRDAVTAFFLPFYTSFGVLNSLKKAVLSITTEEGFIIVFRKFAESLYIAVSGNEEDTEEILTRKLFVFSRIVGLLYGPVDTRMNCPDLAMRHMTWKRLTSLLHTYERLYSSDQIFLLEAVEHVQFGQLQAAQDVVVKLAKECLDSNQNGGLPNVQHAMLLVNTKLLTICGRSPQISTADILLMTLLISNHFHEEPDPEEEAEEEEREEGEEETGRPFEDCGGDQQGGRESGGMAEQTFPEEMDIHNTSGDDEDGRESSEGEHLRERQESDAAFQTPRSTPGTTRASDLTDPYELENDDTRFSTPRSSTVDPEIFRTPSEEVDTPSVGGRIRKAFYQIGGFGKRHTVYPEDARGSLPPPQAKYVEQMVFLQPHQCHYIPHTLHCLEVYPGIVLVLITELQGSNLAGTICQTLLNLSYIFNTRISNSSGQSLYDVLEDAFRRINDMVKRVFQVTASAELRGCNIKVQNVWANLKTNRFRNFLEQEQQPTNARLEACGRDLMDKLVRLFEELYFTPKQREFDTNHVISTLIRKFSSLKRDYGEYLSLKGQLNIPMVSFYLGFPGMIHFILIDRSFDEMTTPSVSADKLGLPYVEELAEKEGEQSGAFLQKKIWTLVHRAQKFLALGYTSQSWMDQHFLYSYYIWVNVPNTVLGTATRFYAPTKIRLSESCPPGVIGTTFYRDVKHSDQYQGYVYELYCIHQSDVSIKTAAGQCRILAEQLWPSSKEAIAPFSLIN